ncbi:MAG: hypothetical protein HN948_10780 [Clostridia bacterium]|jgi:hypothetical protein|nr:hypothetical protein [Clostridia bacterium]MBT7123481.1 hypothetical protein [Clostridia bacterium]
MVTKGRLLILLLIVLFVMLTFAAGCQPGKEEEGQAIVDELIEEGAPTQAPTKAPTPMPTPTPTPAKTSLYFSDELIEKMQGLWPAQNIGADTFGESYVVFCDNGLMGDGNYLTFRYMPDLTVEQIQDQFGLGVYGYVLDELYHAAEFLNETDENGDPLATTFEIKEKPDGNYVYIGFFPSARITVIDEVLAEYWPQNGIIHEALTDEFAMYEGCGADKANDGFSMYRMFSMGDQDITRQIHEWYLQYDGEKDFAVEENSQGFTRVSFTYDIGDNGVVRECIVKVDTFFEAGFVRIILTTGLEF